MNAIGRETAPAPAASCVDAYWLDSHNHDPLSCLFRVQTGKAGYGRDAPNPPGPRDDRDGPPSGPSSAHGRRHPSAPWIVPPGLPPRLPSPPSTPSSTGTGAPPGTGADLIQT
ncbi:hypothetical protein [Streptomyces wuyuanensis]|uniref:hypothetical protein n=1 Tax=Streptomyces wuyuanensis TaxID=1196353 RepID=UPI0034467CBF